MLQQNCIGENPCRAGASPPNAAVGDPKEILVDHFGDSDGTTQKDFENGAIEETERKRVSEYLRKEVADWDDEEKVRSRYKGFSGQTGDYEWRCRFLFWRDLIIKVARYLRIFIIRPHQLQYVWFRRGQLSPLCLDHVLGEMYKNGELLRIGDLVDPKSGQISQLLRRVLRFVSLSQKRPLNFQNQNEDVYIISPLLKEKAHQVVKILSETHWTSSCVITLNKFQKICGGLEEASAVLSYLSESGSAKYLSIQRKDIIEGVKVALSPEAVCRITSLDYDVLHLVWTVEMLEKQLDVIDNCCKKIKRLALASMKSGNRTVALRHARELKLASQGREKCTTLLNRVEEVLRVIADAESLKKVSEAIVIGARAIKENRISVEELELSLEELDESIASQNKVDKLLETPSSYSEFEDEDFEDELQQLEADIRMESTHVGIDSSVGIKDASETTDSLTKALSDLNLTDHAPAKSPKLDRLESTYSSNSSKTANMEAA